jgi:hypothetical protein
LGGKKSDWPMGWAYLTQEEKRAKSPDLYKNTTHTHIHVTSALIVKLEKINLY